MNLNKTDSQDPDLFSQFRANGLQRESQFIQCVPRGSHVVLCGVIYHDPFKHKTGHTQRRTAVEPLGTVLVISEYLS